ncbi:hypothetical protein SK128_024283, partial [Halocaridina rubra]
MAEGKRGRRAPAAGRSALPKVTQPGKNVLHVNLDVRSGVPKATIVHPKQHQHQEKQLQHQKDTRTGVVGGLPPFTHAHKSHPKSFQQHHYQYNNNNINNNNHHQTHHNNNSYTSHSTRNNNSTTCSSHQRESLDEPPKYDEIFQSQVFNSTFHGQQGPQKNYQKKPMKSYFFRHFPKARTFSHINSDNRSANSAFKSSSSSSSSSSTAAAAIGVDSPSGGEGYFAEIHIPPPPTPLEYNGLSSSPLQEEETTAQEQSSFSQVNNPAPQATRQPDGKYTITLKPGHYRINVHWRSKTHPFRITLTPTKRVNGEAPPPPEEQPLYYGSCQAHREYVNQDVNGSFPRRLVHRLFFRQQSPPIECRFREEPSDRHQQSAMASQLPRFPPQYISQQLAPHVQIQQQVAQQQHQLLQQQVGMNPAAAFGDRKGQKRCWEGGPRHRQRKSRYRWASLSCMHLSSLDDSIGEASGGDSYGGYEGVEHLKRHSLGHLKAVSAESLSCGCQGKSSHPFRGSARGRLSVEGTGNFRRANTNYLKGLGGGFTGEGGCITGVGDGGGKVNRNNFIPSARINTGNPNQVKQGFSSMHNNVRKTFFNSNILGESINEVDEREGVTDDSFVFVEKSQLKYHAVSCDALPDGGVNFPGVTVADYITNRKMSPVAGERKTWHEDEAFIKQVVDEYFKDPAPLSDFEDKESKENASIPKVIHRITPDPQFGIAPKAEEESDLTLSSSESSSSSSSTSSPSSASDDDDMLEFLENELLCGSPSIDDTTYCESDDTNSWYTDDSLGYEADAEPSDKDNLGHIWRRWRSAPDVRQTASDARVRRMQQLGKFAGAAAAAAVRTKTAEGDSRGTKASLWWRGTSNRGTSGKGGVGGNGIGTQGQKGEGSSNRVPTSIPTNQSPACGYQPRKSCSVDENKLSRLKFGLRKVRKHKLLQFPNYDSGRKLRGVAPLVSSVKNNRINNNIARDSSNVLLTPAEELEECEFNGAEKLEFVNGKYKAGVVETGVSRDELLCECVRQDVNKVGSSVGRDGGGSGCGTSVDGGSIDDSTTERTERVLTQGLVVHHSKVDHDPHSILTPSVIKNALSILREGITADYPEVPKAVPLGERAVPNEQCHNEAKETFEWAKTNKEDNLKVNHVSKPHESVCDSVVNSEQNVYKTSLSFADKSDRISPHAETSVKDSEDMNRTNITIHLTPPVVRKQGQNLSRRSVESTSSVEITLNKDASQKSFNVTINSSRDKPTDGCLPFLQNNNNQSNRTYENVDLQGRPSAHAPPGNQKSSWNAKNSGISNGDICHNNERESLGHDKRSTSLDSSVRRSDPTSLSRASTISSSSETSSCCHARPKTKSKSSKTQAATSLNESRRRGSSRNTYQNDKDRRGGGGGESGGGRASGTTSSASGQLFGNEYHVQRIQVGTGSNRKFAQATQRSVLEVPVSGSELSDGPVKTVMKSELVLEPSRSCSSTLKSSSKSSQPPTFLSESFPNSQQKTCISEYNIGDAQPNRQTPDEPFNRLAEEFKRSKTEEKSFKLGKEADSSKKSKKSSSKSKSKTPIKYFSGILNAFGSAAPKLRNVVSNSQDKAAKSRRDRERKSSREDQMNEMKTVTNENKYIPSESKQQNDLFTTGQNMHSQTSTLSKSYQSHEYYKRTVITPTGTIEGKVGGSYSKESESLFPSAKTDRLQVAEPKHRNTSSGPRDIGLTTTTVSDSVVPPVPSPRPRRALKNNYESAAANIAPTPPTRRKNVSESSKNLSDSGNEWGGVCGRSDGMGERKIMGNNSPRASPRAKRSKEPITPKNKNPHRLHPPGSQDQPHLTSGLLRTDGAPSHTHSTSSKKRDVHYENMKFHEKQIFTQKNIGDRTSVDYVCREKASDKKSSHRKNVRKSKHDSNVSSDKQQNSVHNKRNFVHLHLETQDIPSRKCANNGGNTGTNNSSAGGGTGGGGGGGGGSSGGSGGGGGGSYSNNQGYGGGSEMDGHGIPGGGWRGGGGLGGRQSPGGSGGESSGGAPGRRRRVRPPSLPTSPLQSSRPRRHSQTSITSGGSLPSSPTRWRRPQFEDTWDGLSDEGGRDYRRLSRTPSAESVESEATSFYYSAMGSTVYDDPKSVYEDASARYSYVTCPQFEPDAEDISTCSQQQLKPPNGVANIPRTISGDVNCDVEVSLSEGEIKVRVRTENEEVTSSTPIRMMRDDDDDSESDDDSDSESHDYEISHSVKSREDSPEAMYSASETEIGDEIPDNEEIKVIATGVVHAVPCMVGTDSSNWSTLSSSYGQSRDKQNEKSEKISKPTDKRESGLVHASPCWATTDSDRRSSISSTDYYSKVCLTASSGEKVYEPQYENVAQPENNDQEPPEEKSVSTGPETPRRRLSGVWTTVEESDDESSEWEDETLPANLQKSFSKASIGEGEEEERSESLRHDLTHDYSSVGQDDSQRNNCVSPRSPSPPPYMHHTSWNDPSCRGFSNTSSPDSKESWEQQQANAWEWHKAVWEHHQKIHEQHLQQLHHQHQHQSLLADVMSCLGGGRWGVGAGNWCHQSYGDAPTCGHEDGRYPHLQDSPTPDCRWSGHFQEDPPYQPAGATSPGDLGKPPPSPLPPSGSHRSRDASSVPRDGARPQSRQRSISSRRRAHSANAKYRVELEIPPHLLLTRQRPSSFSSLAARRPSNPSPEPLEDDLHQEALLYLADVSYDHTAGANRRR